MKIYIVTEEEYGIRGDCFNNKEFFRKKEDAQRYVDKQEYPDNFYILEEELK